LGEALACFPPDMKVGVDSRTLALGSDGLFFDSLNLAVQMEAEFWFERMLASNEYHWYEKNVKTLIGPLVKACRRQIQENACPKRKNEGKKRSTKMIGALVAAKSQEVSSSEEDEDEEFERRQANELWQFLERQEEERKAFQERKKKKRKSEQ
jgi:hypothetical protein